ncbi:hypothetical protein CBF90_12850 [Microbacterium sp. AISO3]|jgi:hypothetical protein|uniref:hypothetical protein n=1 Tax=Microbacterium sp. AISO3 TaxID=2002831 RepID=UPI000B4C6DC7|nr:hypothetical protein [Microbacterium sp. AISO3]OWP21340.1 hypothetical protein CBF90_12850 [Microbacterium sp. AISO3]
MLVLWNIGPILVIAVVIVVAATVFGVAAARARRRGEPSPVVSVALTLSALWAAFGLLGAAISVVQNLSADAPRMSVPVATFWPELLPGVTIDTGPTAEVVGGGFTVAEVDAAGISPLARGLWTAGQALWSLIPAAIAALIAVACFQLLAGRAFTRIIVRMTMATAVIVAAGGTAAQVLSDIAGSMASHELFARGSAGWTEIPGIDDPLAWWPEATLNITLPFWPIAAGLGLAALAAVFRYGSRLQRDTEGLV